MFWAGCAASVSLVTTLIVAGASISLLATLEALSTVTSSARRTASSSFAFSSRRVWPAAAASWAPERRRQPATPRPTDEPGAHASSSSSSKVTRRLRPGGPPGDRATRHLDAVQQQASIGMDDAELIARTPAPVPEDSRRLREASGASGALRGPGAACRGCRRSPRSRGSRPGRPAAASATRARRSRPPSGTNDGLAARAGRSPRRAPPPRAAAPPGTLPGRWAAATITRSAAAKARAKSSWKTRVLAV